jgi:isopenicillin N synthase-like dioxygenase
MKILKGKNFRKNLSGPILNNGRFSEVVKIDYNNLINEKFDLNQDIDKAYGKDGLGLMVIQGIPKLKELRSELLGKGFILANKPTEYLERLQLPETNYAFGWTKARQYFSEGRDHMQAGFYALIYKEGIKNSSDQSQVSSFQNKWPDIPSFKESFLNLKQTNASCQLNLLKHMDKYLQQKKSKIAKDFLHCNFSEKNAAVGLLAIYYPPTLVDHDKYPDGQQDKWCGWHRDYGLLTALTHPMYFNKEGKVAEGVQTGLLVKNRKGEITHAKWETDELVMQSADSLFIFSGGEIISTPHAVKITDQMPTNLYRITSATFFEPAWEQKLYPPGNMNLKELLDKDPFNMSNVVTKFKENITFQEFLMETISKTVVQESKV